MKPLPEKILLPGRAHMECRAVPAVLLQGQGRLAMGTSRAGPGWVCWLLSAHNPQLAMGSPESSGQAITDTVEKRGESLWFTPQPKLLFFHIGKDLTSFGEIVWHGIGLSPCKITWQCKLKHGPRPNFRTLQKKDLSPSVDTNPSTHS